MGGLSVKGSDRWGIDMKTKRYFNFCQDWYIASLLPIKLPSPTAAQPFSADRSNTGGTLYILHFYISYILSCTTKHKNRTSTHMGVYVSTLLEHNSQKIAPKKEKHGVGFTLKERNKKKIPNAPRDMEPFSPASWTR